MKMSRGWGVGLALAGLLGVLCSFAGCGGATSHDVLSFFFDGVPSAADSTSQVLSGLSAAEIKASRNEARIEANKAAAQKILQTMHPPYAEQDCAACHNFADGMGQRSGGLPVLDFSGDDSAGFLIMPAEDLCFTCHDDKSEDYAEANDLVIHSPVAGGECLECHNPHRSPYAHLLLEKNVRLLCFKCHDQSLAAGEDDHPELDADEMCTDCHNPHLSSEEYLLQ